MSDPLSDPVGYLRTFIESSDPELRPGDRLRALELLDRLGGLAERGCDCARAEIACLPQEELDRWDDEHVADVLAAFLRARPVLDLEPSRYPVVAGVLADHFDRLLEERVAELGDRARIEAEVEERAAERARELYAERAFTVVQADGEPERPPDPPEPSPLSAPEDVVPGMRPGWQLERGWSERRRSPFRR